MSMLVAKILSNQTEESRAFHALRDAKGGPLKCDIPRDAFQTIYENRGHAEALRLSNHPGRPYALVPVYNQPRDLMDAWKRFLAVDRPA